SPHGCADAQSIWNLRARFFVRSGAAWRDSFASPLEHADYPCLVPLTVARAWLAAGSESVVAPILCGGMFAVAIVTTLVSSLRLLRGARVALAGVVALLCSPGLAYCASSQDADVPLGLFYLSTVVLVAVACEFPAFESRAILLAGAMAGFAAW